MCAIAGCINLSVSQGTIRKMLDTMRRRGPDGQGIFQSEGCTLLHSRLAIIDPQGGKQPMTLEYGAETYTLVYNGELYNTQEIRRELEKAGHCFLDHSDTEVVLHAYAQWGGECVNRFNGIFAFAVWERKSRRLFLARDRIGVKPLFFSEWENGLLFASEIKTILCYPGRKAQLDADGAYQLLLLGPGRVPGSGVFHGIRELEPGWCGYYEENRLSVHQYWKLQDYHHTDSFEETCEKVRFLVTDSIRRQMVSDVPIGTFLSGGLDSSIISAVCSGEMAGRGTQLPTFSVDYLNNDKYFQPGKFQPNSDDAYIDIMQKAIHSDHHWTVLTPEDLAAELENATVARDLPGMADVDFSLLAFCREIGTRVKVALSGECADEIFGGYPWYRDPEVRAKAGFPWSQTTQQRAKLMTWQLAKNGSPESYVMEAYLETCRQSDILPENSPQERRMKEMVNLNFRWFMQTLLDRKDRMSMYSGLEVRVPFCDYRIAEYLYGVPWEFKDYQGREKGLLRHAVWDLLPEEIVKRKKSPYPKTFDPHYEQLMAERLKTVLEEKENPLFYLIDRENLKAYLAQENEWPWYGQLMRRPQTMAYLLQIEFWLRQYQVDFLF
ncbi:MAG: asparagine synthase (glutamine-hydrolyzing) [Faecousia sp.]